jgi:predicted site-specific integrase-resolvase
MKSKKVRELLNITQKTLNNWIKFNKIKYTKINSNHIEYDDDFVYNLIGQKSTKKRLNIIYSRVSLPKQKNDLTTQTDRLYNFAINNGFIIDKQFEDIKSGMNFTDRKYFNQLLELVFNKEIDTIFIENKDRLARFGFELLEQTFKMFGTKIIVTSNIENKTYEQELTEDLVSIIHHFSMKSYSNRRKLNKMKQDLLENNNTEI